MTAAQAFGGKPASTECAMCTHRLGGVCGAGWREPTAAQRSEERPQRRREHRTINFYRPEQYVLGWVHLSNPACRNVAIKSRSTLTKSFPAMEGRATSTRSSG